MLAGGIHRLDWGFVCAVFAPAEAALAHLQPDVPRLPVSHIPYWVVCPAAHEGNCVQSMTKRPPLRKYAGMTDILSDQTACQFIGT